MHIGENILDFRKTSGFLVHLSSGPLVWMVILSYLVKCCIYAHFQMIISSSTFLYLYYRVPGYWKEQSCFFMLECWKELSCLVCMPEC